MRAAATAADAGGGQARASADGASEGVASEDASEGGATSGAAAEPNLLREWAEEQRLNEPIIGATHGFARSAAEATRSRAQAMAKRRLGTDDD